MGSDSDWPVMKGAAEACEEFDIPFEADVVSAHRMPDEMLAYGRDAAGRGLQVIIAGAGGAAHLPGMLAAVTPLPVIGVPVPLKYLDGMDSLLSIVQMPAGVPVATVAVGNARNAGLLAVRILAAGNPDLQQKMTDFQAELRTPPRPRARRSGTRQRSRGGWASGPALTSCATRAHQLLRSSRASAESDAAVGHGLVVVAGVVDPLVVLVAQRDRRRPGRCGRLGPRVVGGGARTRRRGVRSRSAAQVVCSSPLATRWASENSRLSRPRSRATDWLPRTAGRMPALQARRRASPAERCLVGVEVGCLQRAGQDGVVDGDDDGGGGLGVQVVGGQVLEELGEGESAAVPPVEGPVVAVVGPGSRIRRGAVIASMILPSIAAARAGMVKCPVVVPSPLSCRVSEHFSRAACSSVRMSSFSWASTIFWSGSTASIARRAMRRSWSGLNRAAFATSDASTTWRCSSLTPVGQLAGGSDDHCRVVGETSPASRASAVASCPESSHPPGRPAGRRLRARRVVVLASQASAPVNPASLATRPESAAATSFSFEGLERRSGAVDLGDHRRVVARDQREWPACSRSSTACTSATPESTGWALSGWRSRSAAMGLFFNEHMFESRAKLEMWTESKATSRAATTTVE